MKKRRSASFLPFLDTSIFPDIISFKCIKGPCRFFLYIEIVLALLIVIGTCVIVIVRSLL